MSRVVVLSLSWALSLSLLLGGPAARAALDVEGARSSILSGVTSIHSGGLPGHVVAYGLEAYDIADYPGGAASGPAVVAASWGAGRVLAVGDHQMLDMGDYGDVSGRFYRNGLDWLSGADSSQVRVVTLSQPVADWLVGQGYADVVVAELGQLEPALADAVVFVPPWLGANPSDADLQAVSAFVRAGGGLFIAEYGVGYDWWWGGPVYACPGNRLLREAGIGFAATHRWDEGEIELVPSDTEQVNAEFLLSILAEARPGGGSMRAATLFTRIYDVLGPNDPLLHQLDEALWAWVPSISPTPLSPVSSSWEKALLLRETTLLESTPVDEVQEHRTVSLVWGDVADDATRITRQVEIDPSVTRWHATGLYAAPGDVLTVTVPTAVADRGFVVRISGHTDDISSGTSWRRMPRVARQFPVSSTETRVASAFGGAVYFDVGSENREMDTFSIQVEGAVLAPYFVLDHHTDQEWVNTLRDAPAPYAELVSPRLSLSLPTSYVRHLDEPRALMRFWDEVVVLQDELAQHAYLRSCGERINIDVQVSAGWLHAGYPAQGALDSAEELVDLDSLLQQGSWGWFHELGHEAQRRPDKSWGSDNAYTFDDSVEATVNLFTSYVYDNQGQASRGDWGWTALPKNVFWVALDGLSKGVYAELDVNYKLAMLLELRDAWSWEAWQNVFVGYNAMEIPPADDQAKRDEFLVRFSTEVGHNLTPFLRDVWGVAVSDEAVARVDDLPDWLPALGTLEGRFYMLQGRSLRFDLKAGTLAHDSVADIVDVNPGSQALVAEEDGSWTFTPVDDFAGVDEFSYGVRSSTGHVRTADVSVEVCPPAALMESWYEIEGSSLQDLVAHEDYPDNPHDVTVTPTFEIPVNAHDTYGVRLRGMLQPRESGDYRFWIASDDNGALFLGEDERPDSARLIANVRWWTSHRRWHRFSGQRSVPIHLEAGERYYIEAMVKEGGGGDNLSVAWALDGGDPEVLTGAYVSAWDDSMLVVAEPGPDVGLLDAGRGPDVPVGVDSCDAVETLDAGEKDLVRGMDVDEPSNGGGSSSCHMGSGEAPFPVGIVLLVMALLAVRLSFWPKVTGRSGSSRRCGRSLRRPSWR